MSNLPIEDPGVKATALAAQLRESLRLGEADIATSGVPERLGLDTDGKIVRTGYITVNAADFGVSRTKSGTANSAALQAAVNYLPSGTNAIQIWFEAGNFNFSDTIITGSRNIAFVGQGPSSTRLQFSGSGKNFFEHGLTGSLVPDAGLRFEDVGIYCVAAGPLIAIKAKFYNGTGQFWMRNVHIGSYSSSFSFSGGVEATGATKTFWYNVRIDGGVWDPDAHASNAASIQIAAHFISTGAADKSFVYTFEMCEMDGFQHGWKFDVGGALGNSGSLEGIIFKNCIGRSISGHWVHYETTDSLGGWWPPFIVMDKCNWQGTTGILYGRGFSAVHMTNCWHASDSVWDETDDTTSMIDIDYVKGLWIKDNTFTALPDAVGVCHIKIGQHSDNVRIIDNHFVAVSGMDMTGPAIQIHSSATNVVHHGNVFDAGGASFPTGKIQDQSGNQALSRMYQDGHGDTIFQNEYGQILKLRTPNANGVNAIVLENSPTTFGPTIYAEGPDDNVNLFLRGKNGGIVGIIGGAWNASHFVIGTIHLWDDGAGHLRGKSSAPSSATDGTIII